jgi:hypothetical protein
VATPPKPWIDDNQAKVFVGIGVVLVVAFALAVIFWAPRPVDFAKLEGLGYSLGLGAGGTASAIVVLWLLYAHDKTFWGQAADSITFISLGALLTLIAAGIQLVKAFAAVLP